MVRKQSRKQRPQGKRSKGRMQGKLFVGAYQTPPTSNPREANLLLRNEEMWVPSVGADVNVHAQAFTPGSSGLPILDVEASRFDLYRIKSCTVLYKPACATTQAGRVVLAIDYDSVKTPTSVAELIPMQPQARPQAFTAASVRVDPSRANKQFWLRTANGTIGETSAFTLMWTAVLGTAAVVGEVWVRYEVEFTNPRAVAPSFISTVMDQASGQTRDSNAPVAGVVSVAPPTGARNEMDFMLQRPGSFLMEVSNLRDAVSRDAVVTSIVSTIQGWGDGSFFDSFINYNGNPNVMTVAGILGIGPLLFNALNTYSGASLGLGRNILTKFFRLLTPDQLAFQINHVTGLVLPLPITPNGGYLATLRSVEADRDVSGVGLELRKLGIASAEYPVECEDDPDDSVVLIEESRSIAGKGKSSSVRR